MHTHMYLSGWLNRALPGVLGFGRPSLRGSLGAPNRRLEEALGHFALLQVIRVATGSVNMTQNMPRELVHSVQNQSLDWEIYLVGNIHQKGHLAL